MKMRFAWLCAPVRSDQRLLVAYMNPSHAILSVYGPSQFPSRNKPMHERSLNGVTHDCADANPT